MKPFSAQHLTAPAVWFSFAVLLSTASGALAWEWDGAAWADYRGFLGPISPATKAHLEGIVSDGISAGRVLGRMGQFGDSITESSAYFRNAALNGVTSNETGHDYNPIRSWLAYSGLQPADANSFYRDHGKGPAYGNAGGWTVEDAVSDGHPHDAVEIGNGVTPGDFSWAIVMFGTNDIDAGNWNAAAWQNELRDFVEALIALDVVPVLSTIPPELAHVGDGRVQAANAAIIALAEDMLVPWIDYYGVILHHQPVNWLETLIDSDGTHPTAATGGRGFSQSAQTSTDGYALRTKLAFDAAEKLREIVFEDGTPDGAVDAPHVLAGDQGLGASLHVWPSPTSGPTAIRLSPGREVGTTVTIFDAAGRTVRAWAPANGIAKSWEWDGRGEDRRTVAPGVYFVTARSNHSHAVARLIVVR